MSRAKRDATDANLADGHQDETPEAKRRRTVARRKLDDPLYYSDYLELDKMLDCQHPKTRELGAEAHDEHLFIVIHQAYELWFKQILHEINSVCRIFDARFVPESAVGVAVSRLRRVTEIQRLLLSQLNILETMSPMGFLEFRDVLFPASGFQSVQFRVLENKLGLPPSKRVRYGGRQYHTYLKEHHAQAVRESEQGPTLFELIQQWLERTPFLDFGDFDFWRHYREGVDAMLADDERTIKENSHIDEETKQKQLDDLDNQRKHFNALFDRKQHEELEEQGRRRLSYRAMQAALFIHLHQTEPVLQLPYELLKSLVDMDELWTAWRQRHALMVHRMLGSKMGTGGSSGYHYLRQAAVQHRIFGDFFDISTYLLPRQLLPPLPARVVKSLGFALETGGDESREASAWRGQDRPAGGGGEAGE